MTFADRLMQQAKPIWDKYYTHPFIQGMIDGSLQKEKFLHYLVQDAQYLKDYAKVYAHAFTKTDDVELMRHIYGDMALIMYDETLMHIRYLKDMGWTEAEAFAAPQGAANTVYLDTMIKAARDGSFEEGVVAVMACAFSYYFIGLYANEEGAKRGTLGGDNYYADWIKSYAGDGYKKIYDSSYELCNKIGEQLTAEQEQVLTRLFVDCSTCELHFWDMAFEETELTVK